MAAATRTTDHPVAESALAAVPWDSDHPLVRAILRAPRDYEFFQLLHLIERIVPGAAPIGRHGPARQEPIRLRPTLDLGFPPADIDTVEWRDGKGAIPDRLQITATFMGLYGASSPLPAHFTESLHDEEEDDIRVRDFVDLLHHRIYSLLYRVWVKYRYYVTFQPDGHDGISDVLRGLLGIGTPKVDSALRGNPVRLFRYTGLLAQRPRTAAGLIGLLRDYFGTQSVELEPCVGRWLRIEKGDQNRMGLGKCTLGQDMLLGERVYDRSGKFRVKIGPVGYDDFERFLPDGEAAAALAEIARFYCDDPLDFDIQVILRGEEVPETPVRTADGSLGRLGWTTWMRSQPCPDKSVVFHAPARG